MFCCIQEGDFHYPQVLLGNIEDMTVLEILIDCLLEMPHFQMIVDECIGDSVSGWLNLLYSTRL